MRLLVVTSLLLLWAASGAAATTTNFRLTNLKCEALDKPFAEFSVCRLTVPSRNTVVLNMHVVLHQVPVNNVTVNLVLKKKASGYRSFLYDFTLDFCQFMANRSRNPILKILVERMLENSNINHTCPYDHDIIVRDMYLTDELFQLLPLPLGEYKFHLKVGAYNVWKGDIQLFFRKYESA